MQSVKLGKKEPDNLETSLEVYLCYFLEAVLHKEGRKSNREITG